MNKLKKPTDIKLLLQAFKAACKLFSCVLRIISELPGEGYGEARVYHQPNWEEMKRDLMSTVRMPFHETISVFYYCAAFGAKGKVRR